ncbi:MAG: EamA family transporter [Nitrospirae bacterium]|nr:EamA family transporter [Nitrospirota bacterium]
MLWVIYAFLTAFLLATSDALTKRILFSVKDEYLVAWLRLLFSLPLLMISLLFAGIPPLDGTFWTAVLIALPLEITAVILYTKALKVSPMSLTIPFLAFTPLFLILISYVILGEKVSLSGAAGIILITGGSYVLNIHKARHALMEPVKAILKEKGSMMMIIVAAIFSVTSTLGKLAIEHSSPVFFGSFYIMLVTALFTPFAIGKNRERSEARTGVSITKKDIILLILMGASYSLMIIFHMAAISLTKVAYMISVKRISIIFSIVYGYILFKEEKIVVRFLGGVMMLAGVVLIVLSG